MCFYVSFICLTKIINVAIITLKNGAFRQWRPSWIFQKLQNGWLWCSMLLYYISKCFHIDFMSARPNIDIITLKNGVFRQWRPSWIFQKLQNSSFWCTIILYFTSKWFHVDFKGCTPCGIFFIELIKYFRTFYLRRGRTGGLEFSKSKTNVIFLFLMMSTIF